MATNMWLFYGGIAVSACAALLGLISFAAFRAKFSRLKRELDQEYGEQKK